MSKITLHSTIVPPILRTVFETEAETLILPLAFDLTEKAQTRILRLVIENCPDYWYLIFKQSAVYLVALLFLRRKILI